MTDNPRRDRDTQSPEDRASLRRILDDARAHRDEAERASTWAWTRHARTQEEHDALLAQHLADEGLSHRLFLRWVAEPGEIAPDEDDIAFARETLGYAATPAAVYELAHNRAAVRAKEGEIELDASIARHPAKGKSGPEDG